MLTDITLGQYYPGDSFLHRMDPRAKILCTMIFIVAIFLANNLWSYILVAGFTFLAIALSGVPVSLIWKAIKLCGLFWYSPWVSMCSPHRAMSSLPGNSFILVRKGYKTASS